MWSFPILIRKGQQNDAVPGSHPAKPDEFKTVSRLQLTHARAIPRIFSSLQVPVKAEQASTTKASLPFWLFGSGEQSGPPYRGRLDSVRRNRMRSDSVPAGGAKRFLIQSNVWAEISNTGERERDRVLQIALQRSERLGSVVARVRSVLAGLFACARTCLILERIGRLVAPGSVINALFTII